MTEERQLAAKVSCEVRRCTLAHLPGPSPGLCDVRHPGHQAALGQGHPC